MTEAFKEILSRAKALRLTEAELREAAGFSVARYWRAKKNKMGHDGQVNAYRDLEATLDRLENERTKNETIKLPR